MPTFLLSSVTSLRARKEEGRPVVWAHFPAVTEVLAVLPNMPGWPFDASPPDLDALVTEAVSLCAPLHCWPSFWIGGHDIAPFGDLATWNRACANVANLVAAIRTHGARGLGIDAEVGNKSGPMAASAYGGPKVSVPLARHRAQELAAACGGLPVCAWVDWQDLWGHVGGQAFWNAVAAHVSLSAADERPYTQGGDSSHVPGKARRFKGAVADADNLKHGRGLFLFDQRNLVA